MKRIRAAVMRVLFATGALEFSFIALPMVGCYANLSLQIAAIM
jgi:hypothetical protein